MEDEMDRKFDRSSWAIGGGLMLGLGVGFFFMPTDPFSFVGSMLAGLGVGLLAASFSSR
jgi:hypothetical protein